MPCKIFKGGHLQIFKLFCVLMSIVNLWLTFGTKQKQKYRLCKIDNLKISKISTYLRYSYMKEERRKGRGREEGGRERKRKRERERGAAIWTGTGRKDLLKITSGIFQFPLSDLMKFVLTR